MPKNILADMVPVKKIKREIIKDSPLLNRPLKNKEEKDILPVNDTPTISVANGITMKMDTSPVRPVRNSNKMNDMPANIPPTSNRRYTTYGDDGDCDIEVEQKVPRGSSRYGMWFVALISIVFLVFSVSFLFTKATITIQPKVEELNLNQNLTAVKESNEDGLAFDLVALSGEEEKMVKAGEEKDIETKALGRVVLFNDFSATPQSLNIDTRLESSNGKLYKTDSKITIPGKNKDGTPGSVEVGIYATESGAEYNSGPEDFKIFGFKGTPKYDKFYARSKGEITGGFKGKTRSVSPEDKLIALNELKDTLRIKLSEKAVNQIPEGFILFPDATFLTVDSEDLDITANGESVPLRIKGTLYGFLFKEDELTRSITSISVSGYDNSPVYIPDIKSFVFSLTNKVDSMKDIKTLNFNLTGNSKIIWEVDKNAIISDLLGKSKKDFESILEKYANIDGAELVLRPLWRQSIPSETKSIELIIRE